MERSKLEEWARERGFKQVESLPVNLLQALYDNDESPTLTTIEELTNQEIREWIEFEREL